MYEEKLQKLRDAGVIDMTLSFGCEFRDEWNNLKGIISNKHKNDDVNGGYEYSVIESSMNKIYICTPWNIGGKNSGHDLLYGRACRWIMNKLDIDTGIPYDEEIALVSRKQIRKELDKIWDIQTLDLPLSQQENKEEIVDFICSHLSSNNYTPGIKTRELKN